MSNRSIGEQAADAIEAAAKAKTEALRLRKLSERIFDRILLEQSGGTVDIRRAKVAVHPTYLSADDAALQAESEAVIAKARADGLAVRFEEWRSMNATSRAEMNLR
jgi:hypothetical protein